MEYPIIYKSRKEKVKKMQEVLKRMGASNLFMIEEIDAENNIVILANYIFNKRYEVAVSDNQLALYADAFDTALDHNMFLSVEYDERRGVILG